ncbi:MAG TPA: CpaF family protein [Chloroflexota bacterium]|nr:CpaF family protein [Chloroflexota bacterium]
MSNLIRRLEGTHKEVRSGAPEGAPAQVVDRGPVDLTADIKFRLHEKLLKQMDISRFAGQEQAELRRLVEEAARTLLAAEDVALSRDDRARLVEEVADEVVGLGPIEPLLADPTISEVMVNKPNQVFYERQGVLHLSQRTFRDGDHIMRIIEKIVAPIGRRIDESSPMVDARLADGSRVNCIIPPLAVDSPTITIRKFSRDPLKVDDLINYGSITREIAEFLQACVAAQLNVIISGGTGSGKTTLLNVLSSFIPSDERMVTIEDPTELQLRQPHVVRLETRPPNIEGKGAVTTRDLVRNALRMRPDRIIVGEVRSGEAFDMLQAMNTGHDGSLTTVHANTPRDAVARIENMVLMAGFELPIKAIREQIASAVQLVVQVARLRDGSRRVTHCTEISGMEGQVVTMQDIFVYEQHGVDENGKIIGQMRSTGLRPKFADRIEAAGIPLPPELFMADRLAAFATPHASSNWAPSLAARMRN